MTHWGFAEWVVDVYDGIVGEIEQRMDEHGGSVSLNLLVEELQEFGAKESSIRAYVDSDRYTVENGMVSRSEAMYRPRPPHMRNGAVRVDDGNDELGGAWGQRLVLEERHFAGYSLKVGFDLGFHNGVRPEDSLIVPVLGYSAYEVSVIWRTHDLSRCIDVGRAKDLLAELGYQAGDEIVVVPCADHVRFLSLAELSERGSGQQGSQGTARTPSGEQEQSGEGSFLNFLSGTEN